MAENGSVGFLEPSGDGLFSGEFAGGAEMSDFDYLSVAPADWEIQQVTHDTFHEHDLDSFDSIVVTGTESFNDWQLTELSHYEPFVFVHHLQTPREGLSKIIDNSRMFVTHTPAHMKRELQSFSPKRTGQVLSYFDTSLIAPDFKYQNLAIWAGRNHPLKGLNNARMWAAQQDLDLAVFTDKPREQVLEAMGSAEWFVHLPLAFESECRSVMEAVLAGCRIHTNDLVGITSVEDWDQPEVLRNMIDKAGSTFWQLVQK